MDVLTTIGVDLAVCIIIVGLLSWLLVFLKWVERWKVWDRAKHRTIRRWHRDLDPYNVWLYDGEIGTGQAHLTEDQVDVWVLSEYLYDAYVHFVDSYTKRIKMEMDAKERELKNVREEQEILRWFGLAPESVLALDANDWDGLSSARKIEDVNEQKESLREKVREMQERREAS